jgi:hypothetical protein
MQFAFGQPQSGQWLDERVLNGWQISEVAAFASGAPQGIT